MFKEGSATPTLVKREDYTPPPFWIDTVDLTFDLDPAKTRVLSKMHIRRNADAAADAALRLEGVELNLARVLVNGAGCSFKMDGETLVLDGLPFECDLEIFTTCNPSKNTSLTGLYVSQDTFFTQCEAEGFRRITYFLDRPDVMASYSVTLRADKALYPVLLSNGNLVESGDLPEGKHFAKWIDPHKKPCYLFALVAGKLVAREQRITSRSGKDHLLQVFVRPGDLDKTEHAMNSLMASVAWDEARFNLPLDLERFMIVATSDFNMGAMENKGLNIFNTKYVLANPATATDVDYANIESVVGHEYFHNWTGNRITCRDWFQLSLKEGLTVFRDQEFSQDLCPNPSARAVKRIEDVRVLRQAQFPEDAGPMAHPVRPDQYQEINNFYTVTIYEKGAEVVRMMQSLVGRSGFTKGMAEYFKRHDGQAVTCDDFANAIAAANPGSALQKLLPQFLRWYAQAGTPRVAAKGVYDAAAQTYTLSLTQTCPPTPGQPNKEPFVLPLALGLLNPTTGQDMALQLAHEAQPVHGQRTIVLTQAQEVLQFIGVPTEPVPSLFRGFSAPVILEFDYSEDQLLALLGADNDPFNRWEAAQRLAMQAALNAMHLIASRADSMPSIGHFDTKNFVQSKFVAALREVLRDASLDAAFKELVLTLPSETYIAEQLEAVDPQAIHAVREGMRHALAVALHDDWAATYEANKDTGSYTPDAVQAGRRSLANLALHMLCLGSEGQAREVWHGKAYQRFKDAGNMTDRFGALSALVASRSQHAEPALAKFHSLFQQEALVIDKWFALQAGSSDAGGDILPKVRTLMQHPDFNIKNPNRARSLIFSYCSANPAAFHRADAAGYVFWADQVLALDALNPQVAARLARALDRWKKLAQPYQDAAKHAIERVAAKSDLSSDVREVVSRALAV
ncbi:aminopeptidase N [Variovorax sp. PCZ-1]|uniref:aminopeptidase N n=1 Tax=Variovorax sp. PCZ-1 TaxID=2835533 RepID=UPI001BD17459|nr:aminopeptidase N [Variovorax sp. PCZ-1]MBS7808542.1 aminopeptidase N [Variovorax sp. PCZ-1]